MMLKALHSIRDARICLWEKITPKRTARLRLLEERIAELVQSPFDAVSTQELLSLRQELLSILTGGYPDAITALLNVWRGDSMLTLGPLVPRLRTAEARLNWLRAGKHFTAGRQSALAKRTADIRWSRLDASKALAFERRAEMRHLSRAEAIRRMTPEIVAEAKKSGAPLTGRDPGRTITSWFREAGIK